MTTRKKKAKRTSCGEYIANRSSQNRDKQAEQTFSDLEAQVIRERLSKDAPTREQSAPTP